MKIHAFCARGVHGYMDFNIQFNDDLNFLTGINGSGKTTVVKGISSLTTPSLLNLALTDYKEMKVEIQGVEAEADEQSIIIWAKKQQEELIVGTSANNEKLVLQLLPSELVEDLYRPRERVLEYYHEMEAEYSGHPVMEMVRRLPAPMLLGIERRTEEGPYVSERRILPHYRARRRPRAVFSTSLSVSLQEAISLAENKYREVDAQQSQLQEELRRNILLSALKYETSGVSTHTASKVLSGLTKDIVLNTLQQLGLAREDFEPDLDAFFSDMREIPELFSNTEKIMDILEGGSKEERDKTIRLITNAPQFTRITEIVTYIQDYITKSREVSEPINRYLEIVNRFLRDSNKDLSFDKTGLLSICVRDQESQPVTSLSSGESQIVVIISHLSFNPSAQRANVFIVDEPELSLHVRWQELFVESIRKANPDLQIILATHSPSIILGDHEHCIDLSENAS